MEPHYTNQYSKLHTKLPDTWSNLFSNWNHMSLREDLKNEVDFKLINQPLWSKLLHAFGGAPEISYFLVNKNGTGSFQEPDLNPIKVQIQTLESVGLDEGIFSVRVSPFIGIKVFLNYICPLCHLPPTKSSLFLYSPEES
jgi:hypothetical protein